MKLLGEKRDKAIDDLLRAYISRPSNRECPEFDADLANAYIERALNTASRSRYEQHLSDCAPCRKQVIALSRLAEPQLRASTSAGVVRGFDRRRILGAMTWPRWAMAAAAVIVIAISLPLFLSRKENRLADQSTLAVNPTPAVDNTQTSNQPGETSSAPAAKLTTAASPAASTETKASERRADTVSSNGARAAQQPGASGGDQASTDSKAEAKPKPAAAVEQVQVVSNAEAVTEPAAGQPQQERRTDRESSGGARQQQPSKDARAADNARGSEQNAKEEEQVAKSAAVVPPPAAPSDKSDKMKRSAARLALRDSSSSEAVRPTERRVGGKRFSLKNDTWTDKEFNPDKDLPVVTVIRDSNVYNELISKQAGLKTYLGGFAGTERAIIVYKGTVYKLIPQQGDK